jgi:hypothetical protein
MTTNYPHGGAVALVAERVCHSSASSRRIPGQGCPFRWPACVAVRMLDCHWDVCTERPGGCAGSDTLDVCSRCKYTVCKLCRASKKLGTCYCKDENFGVPYPAPSRRKFYQQGIW